MPTLPAPLKDPRFRPFFLGRLVSMLGDSMAVVALPLAVLSASRRPSDLGVVMAAAMVPHLMLLLVGGAVADRWPRRTVLIATSLGSALTQAAAAALLVSGHYGLIPLAALSMANGAISAFTSPALRGIVPDVVPVELVQQANSLLSSSQNAVRIIGPTAAALVAARWNGGWAVALDAASFFLAAAWLRSVPRTSHAPASGHGVVRDVRQGWMTLRSLPWAMSMVVAFAALNLLNVGPWNVLGADITSSDHGPGAWGLTLSVRAAGLLVTSVLMYRLTFTRPLVAGRVTGIAIGLPLTCLGLRAPLPIVLVAVLIAGFGFTCAAITWESTLQTNVPREHLSRVAAYDDLLSFAAIPVGQVAVGPLAARFGSHPVALICGIALSVVAVAPLISSSVRHLRTPMSDDTGEDTPTLGP